MPWKPSGIRGKYVGFTVAGSDQEGSAVVADFEVENGRKTGQLRAFLLVAALLWSTAAMQADTLPTVGKQNEQTTSVNASLFSDPGLIGDFTLGDDTALQSITLTSITTWEFVRSIGYHYVPHQSSHLYPCPPVPQTDTYSYTNSYSKSYESSTSTTINSELSAKFQGIGAKIGASSTVSATIGTEMSHSETLSSSVGPYNVPAGATAHSYIKDHFVRYSGTYTWFEDVTSIESYGIWHTQSWSVEAQYDHGVLGPYISGGTPCPVPLPASVWGGLSLLTVVGCSRGRCFRRVWLAM